VPVQVDVLFKRIERTAIVICVLMSLAALALTRGRVAAALAVLGGGLLASVSYRLIVASAGTLADTLAPPGGTSPQTSEESPAPAPHRRHSRVIAGATAAGRYALLALLAYVMIARLRLPPLGLLAGASSVVAAVSVEAVRFLLTKKP
jgi:hypothetical protein